MKASADRQGRGARTLAGVTLASRVLGLVRDMVCAHVFGGGAAFGAFLAAWTVPNLFRRMFAEGAVSDAAGPEFVRRLGGADEDGDIRAGDTERAAARTLFRRLFGSMLAWTGVSLLVCMGAAAWVAGPGRATVAGWLEDPGQVDHLAALLPWLLPYVVPICLLALARSALNAFGRFGAPEIGQLVLNGAWIGAALLSRSTAVLAVVVLVAGCAQFAVTIPALRRERLWGPPEWAPRSGEVHQVRRRAAQVLVAVAAAQANVLADRWMAIGLVGPGATTHLFYAFRFVHLPFALFALSASTAAYPEIARFEHDREEVGRILSRALSQAAVFLLPATAGLVVLAPRIVDVFFGHGAFGDADVASTAAALAAYTAGLPFMALATHLARVCRGVGDFRRPAWAAACLVPMNIGLNWALVRAPGGLWEPMGAAGLAWATSASFAVLAAVLAWIATRRNGIAVRVGGLGVLTAVSVAVGGAAWWAEGTVGQALGESPALAAGVLAGLVPFGVWVALARPSAVLEFLPGSRNR